MLAGCSSSTLLSPRHRLRSEAPAQFQACHFPMSTQRLDLPCSFSRKDSSRAQPIRPVTSLSVEKPIESKTSSCSLKQSIRLPPLATTAPASSAAGQTTFGEGRKDIKEEFWPRGKSLKRFAEQGSVDESFINRAKRKRGISDDRGETNDVVLEDEEERLSLGQLGVGNFWLQPGFNPHLPFSLTCSGDEEEERRVCYVPGGEVISPPLPLSNNPWIDSVVTEITDLGEKGGETSRHVLPSKEGSAAASSASSGSQSQSQSLVPRINEGVPDYDAGNGSRNPHSHGGSEVVEVGEEDLINQEVSEGFELLSLLTSCVEAIGSKSIHAINHFIAKLGDLASPKGTPISRVTAYYTEALALRVTRLWPQMFHITPPREFERVDEDSGSALRFLNQVTPIPKFLHFTSNEVLMRAFEDKDRVHIIDFDIRQGLQWPSLFQSLASRTNPPSHVRITGIGESKQELNETGDRLAGFAEALNLPFEFHPVVDRLEDVRLWMLHVKEHESVAVNCIFQLHKTLYDSSGGVLRDFLGLIRSTNPTVVVMAEQEAEHNDPRLEARVCNSLKFYSAIFDSIDASLLPMDSPARIKVEEMFAREIRNIVAGEGMDRLERHENFETWRKLMEQGGFRSTRIGERELMQNRMLLRMYSCDEDYSVKEQGRDNEAGVGGVTLGWQDQPLFTVSAWAPADVAGSSSSFSQLG
uniref:Scarecrow-like protein 28 n=1 Tax=Cannabis sativa TaxID=3483 RepID=A0A803PSK9_CANSA